MSRHHQHVKTNDEIKNSPTLYPTIPLTQIEQHAILQAITTMNNELQAMNNEIFALLDNKTDINKLMNNKFDNVVGDNRLLDDNR